MSRETFRNMKIRPGSKGIRPEKENLHCIKKYPYSLLYAVRISDFGCGDRIRTYDLRVMSPTSYQLLHPAISDIQL